MIIRTDFSTIGERCGIRRLIALKDPAGTTVYLCGVMVLTETAQLVTKAMRLATENNDRIKIEIAHSNQVSMYTGGTHNIS